MFRALGGARSQVVVAVTLAVLFVLSETLSAAEMVVEEEITYGKGGDVDLQLDLARPADGKGPFPAIVFIHGGGWRGGKRGHYRREIEKAARHGYVAVTVTYRLTQPDKKGKAPYPFPAAVHDVKCAVRWLRANAQKYNVDPKRIGATGGSAGGHLSLMLGVTDPSAKLEGSGGHADQSSRVQAVVNYFGPTDMQQLFKTSKGAAPIVASFLDGSPEDVPLKYKAASPITYADKDDPPILTLHGAKDALVPPDQAERFDKKVKEVGGKHTLMLLEKQRHGFIGPAAFRAKKAMYDFFERHLNPAR